MLEIACDINTFILNHFIPPIGLAFRYSCKRDKQIPLKDAKQMNHHRLQPTYKIPSHQGLVTTTSEQVNFVLVVQRIEYIYIIVFIENCHNGYDVQSWL